MASVFAELARPFWLPHLHEVGGRPNSGLSDWFTIGKYEAHHALVPDPVSGKPAEFTLTAAHYELLIGAYAGDCNRMAIGAFESMYCISKNPKLPRSTAWLAVKMYYASFFAAHSILRMLGTSVSQIERSQPNMINQVMTLFGMSNGLQVIKGSYECNFDLPTREIKCVRNMEGSGSHQFLWNVFHDRMDELSMAIGAGAGLTVDKNSVIGQVSLLCANLKRSGYTNGGWLSSIRNQINYQHAFGAWFPYAESTRPIAASLYRIAEAWKNDPIRIPLSPGNSELTTFLNSCSFVLACARELVEDMVYRNPNKSSFLLQGPKALQSLAGN